MHVPCKYFYNFIIITKLYILHVVVLSQKKDKKVQVTFSVLEVHVDEHFRVGNSDTNHKYRVVSHTGMLNIVEVSTSMFIYFKY